jgi:hypothetical protein
VRQVSQPNMQPNQAVSVNWLFALIALASYIPDHAPSVTIINSLPSSRCQIVIKNLRTTFILVVITLLPVGRLPEQSGLLCMLCIDPLLRCTAPTIEL